jgi:hypothetical protein
MIFDIDYPSMSQYPNLQNIGIGLSSVVDATGVITVDSQKVATHFLAPPIKM